MSKAAQVVGATGMKFGFFSRGKKQYDPSKRVHPPRPENNEEARLGLPGRTSAGQLDEAALLCDENGIQPTYSMCEDVIESREERVAQLRQQVHSGSYEIPVAQLVRILTALLRRKL